MLLIPAQGTGLIVGDNQATTSAEYGTSVASHATTAHTKNATYTTLIASTSYDAYGIFVTVCNTAVASTRTGVLVDIALGAASSERVIIPNLIAGNQAASATTSLCGSSYYFPIHIKAGQRVSATAQSAVVADTVHVTVRLVGIRIPGQWVGSKVTAYGVDTAASTGTSMSPGNSAYATNVNMTASSTNPIRYIQLGTDLYTNTAGSTVRGLVRLAIAGRIITDLPYYESTTLESTQFTDANFILSQLRFNAPAGSVVSVGAMRNVAAATRGWAVYGVH